MRDAEVHYARHRDGKRLAYEVFGSGPADLMLYQVSFPIDLMWDLPELASFMETLGGFARVIVFDQSIDELRRTLGEPRIASSPVRSFSECSRTAQTRLCAG